MESNPLVEIGLPVALFIIMTGIGLSLTTAQFARERRAPRGAIVGTVAQLLLMPALGFAVAALLRLPPAIAVGIVIVAASPGGATSNLVAYLARANVALSIVLTVVASVATIVTLPLAANLALRWQADTAEAIVRVPVLRTVGLLVAIVLVPVSIGMAVRRRAPERAQALERAVSAFGGAVLALLIVGIAIAVRTQIWDLLRQSGPAAILLNLGGLAIGWGMARLARLDPRDRLTCAIELGIKNTTLGILIAVNVIGSEAMGFPSAVYGLLMYVSAAVIVARRRRAGASAPLPA